MNGLRTNLELGPTPDIINPEWTNEKSIFRLQCNQLLDSPLDARVILSTNWNDLVPFYFLERCLNSCTACMSLHRSFEN